MNHNLEDVLVSPGDLLISTHEEDADDEEFTFELVKSEGLEEDQAARTNAQTRVSQQMRIFLWLL